MQIKSLKLVNAFQHAELEIPFQPFQAIVGANGSGKSNIIESLGFLLTGEFTLPGTNDSMVRTGAEKGKIEGTLESEGEEIQLVAQLGKSSRSLVRGSLKISKAAEVLEYLKNVVLRTPFNIVNESSIIRQGKLDEGLFSTPAKRTDAFLRMAGLSDIEKKRQMLADAKATVTVPMLSFSVAEAEAKVKEVQAYLAQVWEEHKAIPATDKTTLDAYRTMIATMDQIEKAKGELVTAETKLAELRQLSKEAKSLADSKAAELSQQVQQEELVRPQVEQAKLRIANFERAHADWNKRVALTLSEQTVQAQLKALKAPSEKYTGGDPEELQSMVGEVNAKLAAAHKTVVAFENAVAECPTCHKNCTVQEAAQILAVAKADVSELTSVLAEIKTALTAALLEKDSWWKSLNDYKRDKDRLETMSKLNQQALKDSANIVQPDPNNGEKDRATVTCYSQLLAHVGKVRTEERDAADLLNGVVVQLASMESRVSELTSQARAQDGAIGVSLGAAKAFVADHEQRTRKTSELDGLIQGSQKQLRDEQERLEKLRKQTEEAKTLTQYCNFLEFGRTALHRDNFPSGKVKAFVDRMLINANMYLDCMQAGFSVSYDKDDGFIAFFPADNKHMRADRLSGGQKVTFALAFRFAVNDLHTDTGFLILDEPTVYLDDLHVDYLINALSLVKSKLVPRVQLIIVTHDEKLAAVADSVFEVTKG